MARVEEEDFIRILDMLCREGVGVGGVGRDVVVVSLEYKLSLKSSRDTKDM